MLCVGCGATVGEGGWALLLNGGVLGRWHQGCFREGSTDLMFQ